MTPAKAKWHFTCPRKGTGNPYAKGLRLKFFLPGLVTSGPPLRPIGQMQVQDVSKPATPTESEFLSLLETHQGILHKVCRMYARTEEARRDLFQDIAVQMWRAWPNFRQGSKVSTWMYRIALNVAISGLRRNVLPTESLTAAQYQMPAGDTEPSELVAHLYAALDALSPVEKSFTLLLLDEYSYEEMAEITGLRPDHLRVKMFRIREKLRTIIQKQHDTL